MQRLLLALLLCPLTVAAQSTLNDLDGDGCVGATDILIILGQYGECNDTTTAFACGDSVLFDNYWYETVLIGDQCWFAENLRTTVYENGDLIPAWLTGGEWVSTTTGASSVYGETGICDTGPCDPEQSLAAFGRLYNWYAVDDTRNLCPTGWHVPTSGEWAGLQDYITSQGFAGTEGTALKADFGWINADVGGPGNGTDNFGFTGLPGGARYPDQNGFFGEIDLVGYWWDSTPGLGSSSNAIMLTGFFETVLNGGSSRNFGFSVRCIQD